MTPLFPSQNVAEESVDGKSEMLISILHLAHEAQEKKMFNSAAKLLEAANTIVIDYDSSQTTHTDLKAIFFIYKKFSSLNKKHSEIILKKLQSFEIADV